jgi:hypothetical protein
MAEFAPFELPGPPRKALAMLFALVVLLPTVVTAAAALAVGQQPQASNGAVIVSVFAVSVLVYAVLAAAASRRELKVSDAGLSVRASFYTVFVEKSSIRLDEIRAVDCQRDAAYALSLRTNGLSMPGYQSGWFRTRRAGRAFVVRSGPACVAVPTTKGYLLLLGAADADSASRSLKASLA